jgi:hypothetical protein
MELTLDNPNYRIPNLQPSLQNGPKSDQRMRPAALVRRFIFPRKRKRPRKARPLCSEDGADQRA